MKSPLRSPRCHTTRRHRLMKFEPLERRYVLDASYLPLGISDRTQGWDDPSAITAADNWSNVLGVIGYNGAGLAPTVGLDPQTILAAGGVPTVTANVKTTLLASAAGIAEFEQSATMANATIGLRPSTGSAPYLLIHLNTTNANNVRVQYVLRDIDTRSPGGVQPFALQYRLGTTGDFINVPAGYVADATTNGATQVTTINATLPAEANNQPQVQVRIITADADGTTDEWVGIDDIVLSANKWPRFTLPGEAPVYTENLAAAVLQPDAAIADTDSPNFDTGILTVTNTSAVVGDRIEIKQQGSGAGEIAVSGNTVLYEGTPIGTWVGGSDATPLVVTFNSAATRAAVEAVVRSLTFRHQGENPATHERTITLVVTDGDGGTSATATTSVQVLAVNDAPTIAFPGDPADYTPGSAALAINALATFTDVDETVLNLATLAVQIFEPQPGDALEILSEGNAAGQIAIAGNSLLYGGVEIGTFSAASGLSFVFNASATRAAVQQLLRSLTFRNTLASPLSGSRTVQFTFTEGDTTSSSALAQVNVLATPPQVSIADASVSEGADGTRVISFTVTLSAAPPGNVVVEYTTEDDTATTSDSDYVAKTGTLTFVAGGPLFQVIEVQVQGDTKHELHEQFLVKLTAATSALIVDDTAIGTLLNDDANPSFTIDDAAVNEGDSASAALPFVVRLSHASYLPITIHYTTQDDTATAASGDYVASTGSITFQPGEVEKTIDVNVLGDQAIEPNETIILSGNSAGNTSNTSAQGTGTILNDDQLAPLVVSAASAGGNGFDNGLADSFRLVRNGANLELYIDGVLARSLPLANVQSVFVQGSSDVDTVTIDYSAGYWAAAGGVTIDGNFHGPDNGESDTLQIIADDDAADVLLHRQAAQAGSGSVTVSPAGIQLTTDYSHIEAIHLLDEALVPLGSARAVTMAWDQYEPNDSIATASELPVNQVFAANIDGDTDYFRVTALTTGALDFTLLFTPIGGGATGLPGNGDLDLELYDSSGVRIVPPWDFSASNGNDLKRIRIPAVEGETYYLRVLGATAAAVNSYIIGVMDSSAPVPTSVAIAGGGSITTDNTPTLNILLDDEGLLADASRVGGPVIAIPFQGSSVSPGYRVAVFAGAELLGYASAATATGIYAFTPSALPDGEYQFTARVQMFDPAELMQAGFGAASPPLSHTIDATAPAVFFGDSQVADDGLHPDSDTGVVGSPSTFQDRITSDVSPTFFGSAEAGALVKLFVDSNHSGGLDHDDVLIAEVTASAGGAWQVMTTEDFSDGRWRFFVTATDSAGNVSAIAQALDLVIDTQAPVAESLVITAQPTYRLIATPIQTKSATPLVESLTLRMRDMPQRALPFPMAAVDSSQAMTAASYVLSGHLSGALEIADISFDSVASGQSNIVLGFSNPLPDDRYTLTVTGLFDLAGNPLPTTTFVFTVDSRPEVGVWTGGSITVDTNGNGNLDAPGSEGDVVYVVDAASQAVFAGNFTLFPGDLADGFDKLATYVEVGGSFYFLIDVDSDGVADNEPALFPTPGAVTVLSIGGTPVAGRFDDSDANGDEVGIFDGELWYFDTNHNLVIDDADLVLESALRGQPVVGDFDGDGFDDLATFDGTFAHFDLTKGVRRGWDGVADMTVQATTGTPGQRAVAADMNQDGVDDVGLWVPQMSPGQTSGQWYFILSAGGAIVIADQPAGNAAHRVETDPTSGNAALLFSVSRDLTLTFGSHQGLPIVGNFARPWVAQPGVAVGAYTNPENPYDIDGDGAITPGDAVMLINYLNSFGSRVLTSTMRCADGPYLDVSGDRYLAPQDALMVINYLNTFGAGEGQDNSISSAGHSDKSAGEAAPASPTLPLDLWFNYFGQDDDSDDEEELLDLVAAATT